MPKNAVRRKPANNRTKATTGRADKQKKLLHFSRESFFRLLVFAIFSGVLAVLLSPTVTLSPAWPGPADAFAPRDYIAERQFSTVEIALTEKAQREAAERALPVYAFDGEPIRNALLEVGTFLEGLYEVRQSSTLTSKEKLDLLGVKKVIPDQISEEIAATWLDAVIVEETVETESTTSAGSSNGDEMLEDSETTPETSAADYRFDELSQTVKELLREVLGEGVIAEDEVRGIVEKSDKQAQVELIGLAGDEPGKVVEVATLRTIAVAKEEILKRAKKRYSEARLASAVAEVASQFIGVTIVPDEQETGKRREAAKANVEPVTKVFEPGELIVARARQLTPQVRRELEDYRKALKDARGMQQRIRSSVGHTIILLLLMFGLARCLALIAPAVYSSLRQVTLVLVAITVMVGVGKLISELDFSRYLVPAASVPILLAILMDRRVGLLAGAVLAVLVSMVYGNDWNVLALVMAGSLAGVLGVVSVRKRSDLVRPGVFVAVVSIAVVVALGFISDTIRWSPEGMADVADAAVNGLLVMLIVPGTLSLFESAFRITTDIQLLELTDLDHPVLRRLTMEAPGTHHHSLMVGNLAEAAADAVGANSLLARVCSYYHDVGKLNRPEYFSENQTGYNKHDGLSPVMSSRIIAGHVKDGVELAREYGLCQPVVDIIKQHHGTDLIRFFYEKAVKEDKHNCVREEDFRYPGPKPHSREAAIVMVADAIESASRSLTNLTRTRLIAVADKIVNTRFADGQFDDCDLTLKDLHVIAESIVRVLMSAHHMRVEYPELESPNLVGDSRLSSTN